jgi:O-antigen ligase
MGAIAARLEPGRWVPATAVAAISALVGILAGLDAGAAILAAFGLAFLLLALSDLTLGLIMFVQVAFLEAAVVLGPVLSFGKLAGLLLAISWVATISTQNAGRSANFFTAHPGAVYLLAIFLCWATISVTWAENTNDSLLDLTRYLPNLALFLIVFTAVQTRKQAAWVFGAFIAGTGLTAVYGFVANPEDDPYQTVTRLASSVGNPNQVAMVLVAGLALSVGAMFASRRKPALQLAMAVVVSTAVVALILTGSRAGAAALAVAVLTAVAVAGRWRIQAMTAAFVVTVVTVGLFIGYAPPELRERFTVPTQGQLEATEGRATIWQVGWRMVEDKPLTGVGVGNFQAAAPHYALEPGASGRTEHVIDKPQVAHNIYLHVLAELGVLGLVLFMGIVGFAVGSAIVAAREFQRRGDFPMEIMARALVVAIAGFLTAGFFSSDQFSKLLWLLLALGPSLLAVARSERAAVPR